MGTGGTTMKSKEDIEAMYNALVEIMYNNINSGPEIDGFRRALYRVLNDVDENDI